MLSQIQRCPYLHVREKNILIIIYCYNTRVLPFIHVIFSVFDCPVQYRLLVHRYKGVHWSSENVKFTIFQLSPYNLVSFNLVSFVSGQRVREGFKYLCINYSNLLYSTNIIIFFTGKYTSPKIHTKLHPGLKYCNFMYIFTGEDKLMISFPAQVFTTFSH